MEAEIKEYEIYAGLGDSDNDVRLVDRAVFDNDKEARDYAELCAFGLYNLDPKRDIFEIMKEENVDQDRAFEIFKEEAKSATVFFALEYDTNGTMTRHY